MQEEKRVMEETVNVFIRYQGGVHRFQFNRYTSVEEGFGKDQPYLDYNNPIEDGNEGICVWTTVSLSNVLH